MLVYEENRTEDIVRRLVMIAKGVKFLVIFFCIIIFAGIIAPISFVVTREASGIAYGGIIGIILGFFLGNFIGNLLVVMIEWHAQALVAVENILSSQNKQLKQ